MEPQGYEICIYIYKGLHIFDTSNGYATVHEGGQWFDSRAQVKGLGHPRLQMFFVGCLKLKRHIHIYIYIRGPYTIPFLKIRRSTLTKGPLWQFGCLTEIAEFLEREAALNHWVSNLFHNTS